MKEIGKKCHFLSGHDLAFAHIPSIYILLPSVKLWSHLSARGFLVWMAMCVAEIVGFYY